MDFLDKLSKIQEVVAKNSDRLSKDSKMIMENYQLSDRETLQKEIHKLSNQERLMKIGIVGRVKAGKSSLLNAIVFDGKSILPKAATPMTAALTELSHGDRLEAEIEFFTKEDIINIKNESDEYDRLLQEGIKEEINRLQNSKKNKGILDKLKGVASEISKDMQERAQRAAKRKLDETKYASSKDQYTRIKDSNIDTSSLETIKTIPFDNLEHLQKELANYVGSEGKYMPFTKSVKIKFPLDSLKDVNIIDTPGVNDPVVSREQRTRDALGQCDVIFIVSPAGQFMSKEDLDLMDRITQKNGIRELYAVASKVDTQLYANEKERANGDFHKALDNIRLTLSEHMYNTLTKLKQDSPEIGNAYDGLINQSEKNTICSSGIAVTIKENFDNLSKLDEVENHAWGMLKDNYPKHFNTNKEETLSNLELLSKINEVKGILQVVSKRKDEIMRQKLSDFTKQKNDSIDKYLKDLMEIVDSKRSEIEGTDINELENQQKQIKKIKQATEVSLNEIYSQSLDNFDNKLRGRLLDDLNKNFREASRDVGSQEDIETRTESYEVSDSKWWNPFSWGSTKTETRSYQITTVRAGAIKGILQDFIDKIESSIRKANENEIQEFKKSVRSSLVRGLRNSIEKVGGSEEDVDTTKLQNIVNNIINQAKMPDLSYGNKHLPSGSGVLEGAIAERFMEEAEDFARSLNNDVKKDISKHVNKIITTLSEIKIGKDLFQEYDAQAEQLKIDIENKTRTIEELDRIKKELEIIK